MLDSDIPHSVTQSSFADPCTALTAQNGSGPGFDSGLQTNKQFSITITDDSTRTLCALVTINNVLTVSCSNLVPLQAGYPLWSWYGRFDQRALVGPVHLPGLPSRGEGHWQQREDSMFSIFVPDIQSLKVACRRPTMDQSLAESAPSLRPCPPTQRPRLPLPARARHRLARVPVPPPARD